MGSRGVPVENTVCALRRLAPGAALRRPVSPELRVLARALRSCPPAELARARPAPVVAAVLASQVRALDRAMTGLFGAGFPEAARLVRAARFSGRRCGEPLARVKAEPGLRAAALGWAGVTGGRLLVDELRGVPLVPDAEDGRRAAELVVAALLPRADAGDGREILVPRTGPSGSGAGAGGRGLLDVRSVRVGERGFRVDVFADPPVELACGGRSLALRALWWNGLGRVSDDLGHEYLVLAKDPDGTGVVRHWCHPRPAPGARVLRLESAGYRGEHLRLDPAACGTSAEVLVKRELTVRLAA
ncbi:hypothetical protein QRX60_21070 [Amycolatopsis mongoliensis]|uniref:Uncharacterized protein n=1 Tax=Amycolatopsis mongoliensis TaxID=715475 RepID=A0A9Y2JWX2_9PSEU|nr:hypothetical protein [Amycolatopsis sp. 4-36]WIY06208.1 hypothetical protein QRX60_21070 [Amycolatopsis sp. 4-36]